MKRCLLNHLKKEIHSFRIADGIVKERTRVSSSYKGELELSVVARLYNERINPYEFYARIYPHPRRDEKWMH
jgi:hypothetical protein